MNRFKNQGTTPIQLLAVFYFMVTFAITHKIATSYLAAIDSSILGSHANPSHKTLIGSCKTCLYAKNVSRPAEWVSADVNAPFTVKKEEVFYGHKVHTMVDSLSNLVMGLFISTSSLHDNPLFNPLLKVIDAIVRFRFKKGLFIITLFFVIRILRIILQMNFFVDHSTSFIFDSNAGSRFSR